VKGMLLAVLLLLSLCGCSPNAREPADLALVRVLGVDGASPVTLTAVCGSANGQEPLRGSCTGESFELSRGRLPWAGEKELALTSVSHLVSGQDADLLAVLFAILEDRELGPSALVWLVDGQAAQLLSECRDPAAELELLTRQGIKVPTAAKALGTILTDGSVLLPLLTQDGGRLMVQGEARWSEQ